MTGPPVTPDGRYIVVRGRLWRRADPRLSDAGRQMLVERLMDARRAVGRALRSDPGERGPVWWTDGAPDLTRRMARNTVYAEWFAGVEQPE